MTVDESGKTFYSIGPCSAWRRRCWCCWLVGRSLRWTATWWPAVSLTTVEGCRGFCGNLSGPQLRRKEKNTFTFWPHHFDTNLIPVFWQQKCLKDKMAVITGKIYFIPLVPVGDNEKIKRPPALIWPFHLGSKNLDESQNGLLSFLAQLGNFRAP